MSRVLRRALVVLALLAVAAPAGAKARFGEIGGHLSIGYAKLVTAEHPAGSMSMGVGFDYPLAQTLRAGLDLGYDLLGSRTFDRGSYSAGVDYSDLSVTTFLHWLPRTGIVRRVSLGPTLVSARGALSVTGGGVGFMDLAVDEACAGLAAQVTLMKAKPAPLRVGLELGGRTAFRAAGDWTLLGVRMTVHY